MSAEIKYASPLSSRGRNGKVFLVTRVPTSEAGASDTRLLVCKISRTLDYSVRHEHAVMERLATTGIPNFPRPHGVATLSLDANFREKVNPLCDGKTLLPPVAIDALLTEYIADAVDMDKFLKKNTDGAVTMSLVKQVMLSVAEAYEKVRFTHYDLHSANVLVQKTATAKFDYSVGGKTYHVPSCGYRAVIIDFGLSYADGVPGNYCPLFHTNIGVTPYKHRPHTDFKLFLVSLASDLALPKLDKFVRRIYGKLEIDWETGWDDIDGRNTLDSFYYRCYDKRYARSRVLSEYGYIVMALLQSLCAFSQTDNPQQIDYRGAYATIDAELAKVESKLGCVFYCIYVFRRMVDSARDAKGDAKVFRQESLAAIDSVANYCTLDTLDWNALLTAMYDIAEYMSYRLLSHSEKQQFEYKIAAKNHADIYAKFCTDFPRQIS